MKRLVFACCACIFHSASALIDQPDVLAFGGTGYHAQNWFTYETSIHSDGDGVLFDKGDKFILSPRYQGVIRKVILEVQSTQVAPSRVLCLMPIVDGRELGTNDMPCVITKVAMASKYEFVRFDFNPSDQVEAFRLCAVGSSGNWRIAQIIVFYGEKDENEDVLLKSVAQELPTPGNLRMTDFTLDKLDLAADVVDGAVGYRFQVDRLKGLPRTEKIEPFAPISTELSSGWSFAVRENVKLGTYTGNGYYGTDTSDKQSLKIEAAKSSEPVCLEIESETCDAPVTECSFVGKVAATGSTDQFYILGRADDASDWQEFLTVVPMDKTKTNAVVRIPRDLNIVHVKFGVRAEAGKFSAAALDSLRIVYGGDESREAVEGLLSSYDSPNCSLQGLETGRYGFRVQAVGATSGEFVYRDSSWSAEQVVDLNWSVLKVEEPQSVTVRTSGDRLTVSWTAVADADHYLLDVIPEDDPDSPILSGQVVFGTSETVVVPTVGAYSVCVTAVSPCAKSCAVSESVVGEVALGKPDGVTVEAVAPQTLVASWDGVPLAEGYQVTLERISGDAEKDVPDFSGIPDAWPDGWSHYDYDEKFSKGPIPRMCYSDSWIETRFYERPVTETVFKFKSLVTKVAYADEIGKTYLKVLGSTSETGNDWQELAEHQVRTTVQTFSDPIPPALGMRRLRFAVDYRGWNPNYRTELNLEFTVQSVTFGDETRADVQSIGTVSKAVTFDGLDAGGRYRVVVTPQPGEGRGNSTTSEIVDLGREHFRRTGAIALSSLRHGDFTEDFSSLSNVTAGIEARKTDLDYWQFAKGSGETGTLLYNLNTNKSSTGGVYVCRDTATDGEDSLMLGTLATGTSGSSVGIAFRNDTESSFGMTKLAFDLIQRSVRTNCSTNVLEWLMTDGVSGICTDGDWKEIAEAHVVSESETSSSGDPPFRRTFELTENLPTKIPPGGVLILRWRHGKVKSGPMMAIDNVKIEFPECRKGFCLTVR